MVFMSVKETIAANMKAKKQKPIDSKKFRTNFYSQLTSTVKNDQTDECHSIKNSRPAKSLADVRRAMGEGEDFH